MMIGRHVARTCDGAIEIAMKARSDGHSLEIHLEARHAALYVTAETGVAGTYADNAIDLLAG